MEAILGTNGVTAKRLGSGLAEGDIQPAQTLIPVSVPIETIPTNNKANDPSLQSLPHGNEFKQLGNKGDLLQKTGVRDSRDPLNKETSQSDASELDEPKEEALIYEFWDSRDRNENQLPMRRQKAVRRLAQSKDFLDSVESRISYLEKQMKINPPKVSEDEESKKLPPTKCNVATLDWTGFAARVEVDPKSFSTWTHRAELDEEPKNIIEILMEEPRQGIFATNFQDQVKQLPLVVDDNQSSMAATKNTESQPYQIRIRSKLLLKAMKEITNCQTTPGPHGHRLLLLPPFKLLVGYSKKIRDKIRELQILHGTNLSMTADQGEPMNHQTHDLPLKETNNKEAFQYLSELGSVLDRYFDRQIKIYQGLSPEVCKVRFDDLWYIYKPGDEVRTPGDTRIQLSVYSSRINYWGCQVIGTEQIG